MISPNTKLFNRQNSMIIFLIISSTFLIFYISDVFAEVETQIQTSLTSNGSLNVKLEVIPPTPNTDDETKFNVEFIDPKTGKTQVHIDYRVLIETQEKQIFETNLIHTSLGIVTIPYHFSEGGKYIFTIIVEGILFVPVNEEIVSFEINMGDLTIQPLTAIPSWIKNNAGWWAAEQITDDSFVQGVQYLITNGIMTIL